MAEMLAQSEYGEPGDPVLLIAHGLFGAGRNWRALARKLSQGRRVVCVDMRNHGNSFHSDRMTYAAMAGDLAAVIDGIGGPVDVLGHSMGGKAAMVLALQDPGLLRRLIVADIAPTGYSHSQLPAIEMMRAVGIGEITRRSEVTTALEAEGADKMLAAFLAQSLDLETQPPRWTLNLDALAAGMEDIIGFPPVDGQFDGQTLFLTGGASEYVQPQHHPRIRQMFPAVEFSSLDGAGHWLHAEQPRQFIAEVERFLGV